MQRKTYFTGLFMFAAQAAHISRASLDAQCVDSNDPACAMFTEDFDEDGTYLNGYTNGEELGKQNCIDGEEYHDFTPIDECAGE